jgi:transposase-like protein
METHRDAPPPACPYLDCRFHESAPPGFYRRFGFYRSRGYPGGIRRYRCSACLRSFSIRRFTVEFRLHKPKLTPWVIAELTSCVSLRQAARSKRLCRGSIERRLDRFGLHGQRLLDRVSRVCAPLGGRFLLDEAESFETSRLSRPVTIPVLVHGESRFIVAIGVGAMAPRRRELAEPRVPRRVSESSKVVRACLARLVRWVERDSVLASDQKASYVRILRELDPTRKLHHVRYSGRLPRGPKSPLFEVNHTNAMLRDGNARLKRRTWCVSKKRERLWRQLGLYALWRNFRRPRYNRDKTVTPAQFARVSDHRWTMRELVRWRVDLGAATICPLAARHAA